MTTLDFVVPAINVKAILPQILLAATALTVLLIDVFSNPKTGKSYLGYLSLAGLVTAMASVLMNWGAHESAYSGMLMVDNFAGFITVTVCVVGFLTILVSSNYQKAFPGLNCGEFYCLLLFAVLGMSLMGAAGNLIMLFLALETMSISIYVLAGFQKDRLKSIESAMKYFLLGAFASGFLLYGFALVYGATGSLDLVVISGILKQNPEIIHTRLMMGGMALMTVGFGFKIAMVPFHMWTPDVYEGAPTSITAFMATGVKAAAFAALLRVYYVALPTLQVDWTGIMWIIALLTMTFGNVIALSQSNLKRMLAYSSIAHAGYLLVGFIAGGELAVAGMLFYLLGYAFMNLGAFGVIALLAHKGRECNDIADFAGLGFKYPLLGLSMSIFMFSMAGIPPTAGFMGKFYIFTAAIKEGYIWLAIFGVINSVISIYYYLRVIVSMYFQEPEHEVMMPAPAAAIVVGLTLSSAGVLVMGIFPSFVWTIARNSAQMFM